MVSTVGTIIWFTWASLGIAGALSTSSFQEIQEQTNTLLGYKEKISFLYIFFSTYLSFNQFKEMKMWKYFTDTDDQIYYEIVLVSEAGII